MTKIVKKDVLHFLPNCIGRPVDVTSQSIIVQTEEIKSLLPSLYKREEYPSL